MRVFSEQHPSDILAADTSFIDEIGLKEHLSPTRANGLLSMIKQLKMYKKLAKIKYDKAIKITDVNELGDVMIECFKLFLILKFLLIFMN